jgi:uncharacterized membrane protein
MSFIAKFHPLLVHFPIALVMAAAVAEIVVIASSPLVDASTFLEWHRWVGMTGAAGAIGAALLSSRLHVSSHRSVFAYRLTLFVTALLVAIAGHLGGTLVWGARFFQP